ncbi:MAG: hypothetical protein ACW963_02340 [Candidatus Sifarchaeia archaeon]|jgi:hypothetical protein
MKKEKKIDVTVIDAIEEIEDATHCVVCYETGDVVIQSDENINEVDAANEIW